METPTESTELQTDAREETDAGPSDVELVSEVRAGQEDAFEELFRRHRRRVALIASRFFRHREQIEEVVQESFAKAFFALGEFSNRQAESFGAWLSRIAFNVCYDELRRLKRRPESSLSELDEDEAARLRERSRNASDARGVESRAVSRELAAKLLARLSPEDRLVLVMLEVEGLSTAEIAEVLGWSVSKVKVRAHRARAHLRRVLKRFV
ncbi:MAG TPA: sigma-70 family RNA polymerase sigma factor [Pyrinomonadaceae bacterium]|nr:sigma-70 family RNA polymerase sigma factor [Pyrinomonadaceae bacterium]